MRWFDPAGWLKLAQQHRAQRTTLVPSMIQMLLAQPLDEADLSELVAVSSGAAPLAAETREEFERRVPSALVYEGYGCTESASIIASNPVGARRVGSVGLPVPGCTVQIRDDAGRVLAPGEDGEICVQSPGVLSGYWHAPDATATAVRDGWLYTGDVGHLDADGYVYVVDRKKDLIIRGGFNVYPRDVEDVLLTHPAVAQAAVVGRPDPRLGEEVVGVRRAAARRDRHRGRARRPRQGPAGRDQVPARGPDRARDPADQCGQARPQAAADPGARGRPGPGGGPGPGGRAGFGRKGPPPPVASSDRGI